MKISVENDWNLDEALAKFFESKFEDGHVVSHEFIDYMINIPPVESMDARIWSLMRMDRFEAVRDVLLTVHRIYLSNVRGKGYLVVPPREQAVTALSTAMGDIKRALSKAGKAIDTKHVRMELLDSEESKRHTDAIVRLSGIRAMVNKEKKNVFDLLEKK
ncbi:MAG: hypothetical protein ACRENW_04325 [Thermodesulfobacteriota bacterium]